MREIKKKTIKFYVYVGAVLVGYGARYLYDFINL